MAFSKRTIQLPDYLWPFGYRTCPIRMPTEYDLMAGVVQLSVLLKSYHIQPHSIEFFFSFRERCERRSERIFLGEFRQEGRSPYQRGSDPKTRTLVKPR